MILKKWLKSKKKILSESVNKTDSLNQYHSLSTTQDSTFSSTYATGLAQTITDANISTAFNSLKNNPNIAATYSYDPNLKGWENKEKKHIANVGFVFNEDSREWKLKLSIEVSIPQTDQSPGKGIKPTDEVIEELKKAKKYLEESLTAKIILAELTKPREIEK